MPDVAAVALAIGGPAYMVATFRRFSGRGRAVRRIPLLGFGCGFAALALALASPIDAAAEHNVAWHMVQHLLLITVAPPLLVIARPVETMVWLLAPRARRRALRRWARVTATTSARWRTWIMVAIAANVLTVWTWHVPAVYDAATSNIWLHQLEHLTMIWTGFLVWWVIVGARRVGRYGEAVLAVFISTLSSIGLGAMLLFARRPLYTLSARSAHPVEDQQIAGVLMWAFGGLATLIAMVTIFAVWMRWLEHRPDLADDAARDVVSGLTR